MTSPASDLPCFSQSWSYQGTFEAHLGYTHFRLFLSKGYFWAVQKLLGSQIVQSKGMPLSHSIWAAGVLLGADFSCTNIEHQGFGDGAGVW